MGVSSNFTDSTKLGLSRHEGGRRDSVIRSIRRAAAATATAPGAGQSKVHDLLVSVLAMCSLTRDWLLD